jgi:uncharacterized protein YciI
MLVGVPEQHNRFGDILNSGSASGEWVIVVYFLLLYKVVDDYIERRSPFREEHLGLAREANERGELVLAGAYADPPDGAALVFRADDDSVVRDFVAHDPYVREGLVNKWTIRQWTVVIGDP